MYSNVFLPPLPLPCVPVCISSNPQKRIPLSSSCTLLVAIQFRFHNGMPPNHFPSPL